MADRAVGGAAVPEPAAPAAPAGARPTESRPLTRRTRTQRGDLPPPSLSARLLALLVPWLLLLLLLGGLALGYRLTVLSGSPRLTFAHPLALLLGALVPLLAARAFHFERARRPAMLWSRAHDVVRAPQGPLRHFTRAPAVLRLGVVALLVLALARPQLESGDAVEVEGIDIVIALDVSNSMSEQDIAPDRLRAAKEVLRWVIGGRKSDRIGLVLFGREAFTQCPLTLDYRALTGLLAAVDLNLIDGRGTAIGNAIATALNRLRRSEARSKVIILLTDGDNNAGNVSPQQAARFAQSLGVKVFTILMGSDVEVNPQSGLPRRQPRYPVNPKLLEEIAGTTGGTPYLATDARALKARFQSILDELDRSRIKDQKGRPRELYPYLVGPALALLLLELLLSLTRFRRFP